MSIVGGAFGSWIESQWSIVVLSWEMAGLVVCLLVTVCGFFVGAIAGMIRRVVVGTVLGAVIQQREPAADVGRSFKAFFMAAGVTGAGGFFYGVMFGAVFEAGTGGRARDLKTQRHGGHRVLGDPTRPKAQGEFVVE